MTPPPAHAGISEEIGRAIRDPGSVVERQRGDVGFPNEAVAAWQTRAVLSLLCQHIAGIEGENARLQAEVYGAGSIVDGYHAAMKMHEERATLAEQRAAEAERAREEEREACAKLADYQAETARLAMQGGVDGQEYLRAKEATACSIAHGIRSRRSLTQDTRTDG